MIEFDSQHFGQRNDASIMSLSVVALDTVCSVLFKCLIVNLLLVKKTVRDLKNLNCMEKICVCV